MKLHELKVELVTATDIPLNLTEVQKAIRNVRQDAYVIVTEV